MNIHFFKTNDKFTRPMFFRLLWPALASSFGWALSDMADAIVVGQSLGSTGLAWFWTRRIYTIFILFKQWTS